MKHVQKLMFASIKRCGNSCLCGDKLASIQGINEYNELQEEQYKCYKYKNYRFIEHSLKRMKEEYHKEVN